MPSDPPVSDALIEIDHVTFGYDTSRRILNDITLRFARGKVTSILGSSGCGCRLGARDEAGGEASGGLLLAVFGLMLGARRFWRRKRAR